jgi:hypothetical protein
MSLRLISRRTGVLVSLFCLLGAVAASKGASPPPGPILQNGGFDTGSLSGWTTFVTANGSVGGGFGLPNVTSFDTAGTGTVSASAQLQVGEAVYNGATGHTSQGGGIYQTFNCIAGIYFISADVAAYSIDPYVNSEAGLFLLSVDQTTVASIDFGQISTGQTLRDALSGSLFLSPGAHTLTVEITRPWVDGSNYGDTPLEYLDNIQVTPVPEASSIKLALVGILTILCVRHRSKGRGLEICGDRL